MDQKCLPSWRNPATYPTSPDADAFVHASHLMGGVHQRGGRRAAHRAAHRGAVGPERSGRSILKLTSLCRCAGPREAAFCILRASAIVGGTGLADAFLSTVWAKGARARAVTALRAACRSHSGQYTSPPDRLSNTRPRTPRRTSPLNTRTTPHQNGTHAQEHRRAHITCE